MVIYIGTFIKVKRYEKSISVEHYICEKCERKYYQRDHVAPEFCQYCGIALKVGSDTVKRQINSGYDIKAPLLPLTDLGLDEECLYIGTFDAKVYGEYNDGELCEDILHTFVDIKDMQQSFKEFCKDNETFLMALEEQCRDYQICTGTLIL